MNKSQSLVTAFILDGEGFGEKIDWSGVEAWQPHQGVLWVNLDFTVDRARRWLKKQKNIDPIIIQTLLADEVRPRTILSDEGIYVSLRGVNHNPGSDPEDMVSIRMWLTPGRIITTRRRKLLTTTDISRALQAGHGPKTTSDFLLQYSERLTDRMSDYIEQLEDRGDGLEQAVLIEESRQLRPKISDIRREAVLIRRYLAPQREAMARLTQESNTYFTPVEKARMRESADRVIRYIEELDSIRERVTITQEELSSRLSEQLDRRMYLLSLMAVIFLPITFITGLLGINVAGIPGADNPSGFITVCWVVGSISALTLGLLRYYKWL